ncbi:DUF5105 domain-containing protein [Bacillus licheniformis]|nr:DUF5105 domain-containing protein [Bacillus licheniformis]
MKQLLRQPLRQSIIQMSKESEERLEDYVKDSGKDFMSRDELINPAIDIMSEEIKKQRRLQVRKPLKSNLKIKNDKWKLMLIITRPNNTSQASLKATTKKHPRGAFSITIKQVLSGSGTRRPSRSVSSI